MKEKQLTWINQNATNWQVHDPIKRSLRGSTARELKAAALKHVSCVSALIDMLSEQEKISQRDYLLYDLEAKMTEMGLRCITRRYVLYSPDIYNKKQEELKQTGFQKKCNPQVWHNDKSNKPLVCVYLLNFVLRFPIFMIIHIQDSS